LQNKSFIFWLFNKDKKPLYEDKFIREADSSLKPNGQPAHLQHSPDGWRDTLVKYGRNLKYLGVFRDFTAPMNFKKDGAHIVKDAMWKLGMEAILYLAISKLNRTVYPPKYEPWYVGELDFSKFDQKKSNVILNVMEGGLSKYLKAYESTTYEIPIDADPEAKLVVMDGFPFTNTIQYELFEPQAVDGNNYIVGMGTISQEGSSQGVLNQDTQFETSTVYPNDQWFMSNESKFITVNITGSININVKTTGNLVIRIERVNSLLSGPGAIVQTINLFSGTKNAGEQFTINVNEAITFEPNERLYLKALPNTEPSATVWYEIKKSDLTVTYEVTFEQTIIKALTPLRLFQKIVEKMTEGRHTASSSYLASMTDLLITSGSAIRNHEGQTSTVNGSIFKTSLDEFFSSLKSKGIGLGIENDVLIIEKTSYFFKNDVAIELGEVSDFEVVVAEDLVFNTIKVGYPNQTYDAVNGKDEFNVTQNYTTPHTRIVKELDLVSPYRADAYGIELIRLNLDGKDTTDNSADNDTFFLNVKQGGTFVYYSGNVNYNVNGANTITIPEELNTLNGATITITGTVNNGSYNVINTSYLVVGSTIVTVDSTLADGTDRVTITYPSSSLYSLNRPAYSSITGLLHPDKMFNVELSPKTNLLNNSDYIHSVLDFQDMNFVKFQSGEKNSDLSRTLNGVTITEKSNVQIAQLANKLFRPYYFTFKVPTDYNFLKTIAANPYSKLSFTVEGNKYYGYLIDGGVKPATCDVNSLKLLCAPETNLSQLINLE
jgi:hypothetical protein